MRLTLSVFALAITAVVTTGCASMSPATMILTEPIAAVSAATMLAPDRAPALVKDAIDAQPQLAIAITVAAVAAAPDRASDITRAAIVAAPAQAMDIADAARAVTRRRVTTWSQTIPRPEDLLRLVARAER